jgi:hypothetical protein
MVALRRARQQSDRRGDDHDEHGPDAGPSWTSRHNVVGFGEARESGAKRRSAPILAASKVATPAREQTSRDAFFLRSGRSEQEFGARREKR